MAQIRFPQTKFDTIVLRGGLDLITPTLNLPPGVVRAGINFEASATGGYTRIAGYERVDGRAAPSSATFIVLTVTGNTLPAISQTVTGGSSGATGNLIALTATQFVLTQVVGTFTVGEALQISAVTVATNAGVSAAQSQKLYAQYRSLSADVLRALIAKPTGSGALRGAFYYNGVSYCFRDNVGGTACVMFKSTASGWSAISFGSEISFGPNTSTVTMTIATPGVVTWTAHGLAAGTPIIFTTTGALPTGITAGVTYYVVTTTANTFQVAATVGGASITTSGSQSGTHTCTAQTQVQINDAATVTGLTSGATATVGRVVLQQGAWTGNATGRLVISSIVGTFQSGEAIRVSGVTCAMTTSLATAITLQPGGKYEFTQANFYGQAKSIRMYGCDGKNRAFEWDGTVFVPITTGTSPDTPTHIAAHKKQLFLSFNSSVIHSAPGLPYDYFAGDGASEIATGDVVTDMTELPGNQTTGTLAIFNQTNTNVLYGTSVSNWNLVAFNTGTGALPFTAQNMAATLFLDSRGVFSLQTTLNYGNFEQASLTANIRPFIEANRQFTNCSVLCRAKSQYRVFYSNGLGLYLTMVNDQFMGVMQVQFPVAMSNAWSGVDAAGNEIIYLCGADGMLYQAESGTSFDGAAITANITTVYDSVKSPRILKQYRKAAAELSGSSYAELAFSYILSYGSSEHPEGTRGNYTAGMLAFNWDTMVWDTFYWDGTPYVPLECDMDGTAENVALNFLSSGNYFDPFTINSVVVHYTPRRGIR